MSKPETPANIAAGVSDSPIHRLMREMVDSPTQKAMREILHSPTHQAMYGLYDSQAAKVARDFYDLPWAKTVRELCDSPTIRMARELQDSQTMRMVREMQARLTADPHWLETQRQLADAKIPFPQMSVGIGIGSEKMNEYLKLGVVGAIGFPPRKAALRSAD
jgi:hypothetical protein